MKAAILVLSFLLGVRLVHADPCYSSSGSSIVYGQPVVYQSPVLYTAPVVYNAPVHYNQTSVAYNQVVYTPPTTACVSGTAYYRPIAPTVIYFGSSHAKGSITRRGNYRIYRYCIF